VHPIGNIRGLQGGPRTGCSDVSAPGGIPLRTISAAAAMILLTIVALGTVVTVMIPVSNQEAAENALDYVGGHDCGYIWKCPNRVGIGYHEETIILDISEEEFLDSMDRDVLRQGTMGVPAPVSLLDPADRYVRQIADHILDATRDYSEDRRIDAALNFVQTSIRYTCDDIMYGTDDFWAAPLETLYLHRGDCEDTTVLLCSIYLAMGYDSVILNFPGHEAVGVYWKGPDEYLFCETTYDGPKYAGYEGPEWTALAPDVHRYGDEPPLQPLADFFATYRNLISKVAGT